MSDKRRIYEEKKQRQSYKTFEEFLNEIEICVVQSAQ